MQTERVVVITGAGGGIGSRIVDRFLSSGDRVVGLDKSQPALERLQSSRNAGDRLSTVRADVTSLNDLADVQSRMERTTGRVDVLVNCAGFYPTVAFEQMTPGEWQDILNINLTGAFNVIHTLLPLLKGRGWGRIVNIASASIFEGVAGQTHYVAAKAGIVGLTRSLAMELGKYGLTVNAVAPGLTLTEPVRANVSAAMLQEQVKARALQRDEQPQDLAGPVFLLCSPDADFISGQMLVVDGGKTKH